MAIADTAKLVASLELQDKFSGPARGIDRSIGNLERSSNRLGHIGSEASRGIGQLATNFLRLGTIAAGITVVGIIGSIRAASDLNEEIDKSKVVFGEASAEVIAFSRNAATIGLATSEALGAAGAFGNMFNTIGLAQDESADMSVVMVQLAADMASFNNEDPSEMLDRLRSGLSGEAEPLRRFGVLISEATVKDFAYRTGIVASGEALTEAQKVQARYGLILEQTAIQQGNFADTSESVANQQRILRANLKNTAAVLGTAFLPSLSRVSVKLNEVFVEKQPQITAFAERLAASLERVFTNENIDRGIASIGSFVDRLSTGDVSGIFSRIGQFTSGLASLPWASIGDAARLLGTGSKALLDAFLKMPPWVQTAVLTGWGLNKLTGGALGSIVSSLASGLIKGVLGINAGVVNVNAATVRGGAPVAGPGGGPGLLAGALRVTIFGAVALALGEILAQNVTRPLDEIAFDFNQVAGASGLFSRQQQAETFAAGLARKLDIPLERVKEGIVRAVLDQGMTFDEAVAALTAAANGLNGSLGGKLPGVIEKRISGSLKGLPTLPDTAFTGGGGVLPDAAMLPIGQTATATAKLPPILTRQEQTTRRLVQLTTEARAAMNAANSKLGGILAKPTSFTNNTNVTVNIDGRKVAGIIAKNQLIAGA